MLTGMIPMLICNDVQSSIKFYTDVVGLELADRQDEHGKSGWAMLQKNGVKLMLASPHYFPEMPKVQDRYFQAQYYFYTSDIEGLRSRIEGAGHEPSGIVEQPWGMREFEMADPDGHLLVFGQSLKE